MVNNMSESEVLAELRTKVGRDSKKTQADLSEIKQFLKLSFADRLKMAEEALSAYGGS